MKHEHLRLFLEAPMNRTSSSYRNLMKKLQSNLASRFPYVSYEIPTSISDVSIKVQLTWHSPEVGLDVAEEPDSGTLWVAYSWHEVSFPSSKGTMTDASSRVLADKAGNVYVGKELNELLKDLDRNIVRTVRETLAPLNPDLGEVSKFYTGKFEGKVLIFSVDLPSSGKTAAARRVHVRDLPTSLARVLRDVGYNRRDIEVTSATTYSAAGAGGDGYRDFVAPVNLATGQYNILWGSWGGANAFNPHNQVDQDTSIRPMPVNGAVVKGWKGGGRPTYAEILVHPDNLTKLLPSAEENVELSPKELAALNIIGGIKSSYRKDEFRNNGLGPYTPNNPYLQSLASKGLVKVTGTGVQITLAGKNVRLQQRSRMAAKQAKLNPRDVFKLINYTGYIKDLTSPVDLNLRKILARTSELESQLRAVSSKGKKEVEAKGLTRDLDAILNDLAVWNFRMESEFAPIFREISELLEKTTSVLKGLDNP